MLDKEEEGGEDGDIEEHQRQHDHQNQGRAGVLTSPVIMVPLVPDPGHGVMVMTKLVIIK